MTTDDLAGSVTGTGLVALAAVSAGAWLVAGVEGAAGVAGGGAVALLNFRWLARDVARAVALMGEGRRGAASLAGIGLRQLVTFGALGLLVANRWTHPLAVLVGLSVLPPVLFCQAFRAARASR